MVRRNIGENPAGGKERRPWSSRTTACAA